MVCIDCGYPHDWCRQCTSCACECSCCDDQLSGVTVLYPDELGQRASRMQRPVSTTRASPDLL